MSQPRDNWRPPQRLEKKRDLYMFLALHMENSPVCGESEKFHKTGIVVCESDKVHKLMSMCCSSKSLHAVQQVMLNTPITLRNCSIYMSRKPCSACTKFLIQGEISSVCYWPRHPELKEDLEQDLKQVDLLFLTSPIISSVFVPLIDHIDKSDKKSEIAHRTRRFRCSKCNPCYTEAVKKEDCEKNCTLLNLQDCVKSCNKQMEDASEYLDILLHCVHGEFAGTFDETFNEIGKEQHIHALQLCFLLAARSDDPDKGVGCLLYDKNGCNKPGYFFGAGYNGYPIGALYGNLPRCGRGDLPKKEALVHAEQNALLFRSNKQIKDTDVLYCSKPPCLPCQNYIDFVGIKRIISVKDSSTKRTVISELKDKFKYVQYKCATEKLTDSNPKEKREDVSQKGEAKENISPSARIQEKRDLCMFLALHMENSPYCGKPKSESPAIGQFSKTGIVICEGLKFERIVAMDCSTENLHAVQKALLRLPDEQKGRQVFLSRIPCISCVKFLVQAQVSKIYFWPNFETEIKKISEEEREELQHRSILINNILKESCVYDAMFIPILNLEKAKIIASKANTNNISNNEISSVFDNSESDIKFALKLLNMSFLWEKEQLKNEVENAKKSFQILTGPEDKEYNFQINDVDKCKIQHASQLCNLLAARSDTYNKGEGTVIYKENSIVSVGYSGFPKGTMYDLFKKKNDGSLNHRIVVCAEANALILGPKDHLKGAELITTKEPCDDCKLLIEEKGIIRTIYPIRSKEMPASQRPSETNREEEALVDDARDNTE